MTVIDQVVFISKDDILRIRENHDPVRMVTAQFFVELIVVNHTPRRRFDKAAAGNAHLNKRTDIDHLCVISEHNFFKTGEQFAFAARARFNHGQIVRTEHHILCRDGNGFAVFRRQNIMSRKHERTRFRLGFHRERQMAGHLVAVEIGIVRRADKGMELDGASFPKDRLKSLDPETMQRRGAVQENGMLFDYAFQDIPYLRVDAFNLFLCVFDIRGVACFNKLFHDKRLEQFKSHFLRQPTLMHF